LIENDWGDARFPLVPSHEMVGIVDRTGSRVTELKPGDRVGVGFQLDACFECSFCRRGTEQFCSRQRIVGVSAYGGLGRVALRFLRAMGHRVSAVSRSPEERRTIEQLGAEYVDGADSASLAAYRNTFDLILSTLNVPFDLNAYLGMLATAVAERRRSVRLCAAAYLRELEVATALVLESLDDATDGAAGAAADR
jgi:D-arabinose 1-dehydrogenase-like Zn-dependent alcohol dehydrogenase